MDTKIFPTPRWCGIRQLLWIAIQRCIVCTKYSTITYQLMWWIFWLYWRANDRSWWVTMSFSSIMYHELHICVCTQVKLYDKAHRAISSYGFFNERTWRFKTNNWQYIFDKMAPQDRSTFNFDVSTINWRSYMKTYCHGIRQFIQKDDPDSVPLANKKLQR